MTEIKNFKPRKSDRVTTNGYANLIVRGHNARIIFVEMLRSGRVFQFDGEDANAVRDAYTVLNTAEFSSVN